MRLRLVLRLCACALLVGFTSCTSTIFESADIASSEDASLTSPGLIYYLPRTVLTATVTPYGVTKTDAQGRTPQGDEIHYLKISFDSTNVADIRKPYSLKYTGSAFATDQVCAGVKEGLLAAVEAASADETGNILLSIAGLAGRAGATPFSDTPKATFGPLADHKLVMSIDPLDPAHIEDLERAIFEKYQLEYRLKFPNAKYLRAGKQLNVCPLDSVCYRTKVPLEYVFHGEGHHGIDSKRADRRYVNVQRDTIDVVNQSYIGHVNVTRAFMVEKITRLEFQEGVLKSMAIRKPSEALAKAKLPLSVYETVAIAAFSPFNNLASNLSGLTATDQLSLIKSSAEIQVKLDELETKVGNAGADFLSGPLARIPTNEDLFKIRCNGSFIPPKG